MRPVRRAVLRSTASTMATWWSLQRLGVPGGRSRWTRVNHRGQEVTLTEGVALVAGSTASLARRDPVSALTCLGAGLVGAVDDLHPDAARKGLVGHLGALIHGDLSIGALKALGLTACGALAGAADRRVGHRRVGPPDASPASIVRHAGDTGVRACVVAGSANLANLLDLRPGRALKVALLLGIPLSASRSAAEPAGAAVGAALVLLPVDLRAEGMLGDTGANAVGALLGLAVTRAAGPRARVAVLAGLVALTLVSERVSFTRVIESTPVLRGLDAWGRQHR